MLTRVGRAACGELRFGEFFKQAWFRVACVERRGCKQNGRQDCESPNRAEREPSKAAVRNSVCFAARAGVKCVGNAIYDERGVDLMLEVLNAAADRFGGKTVRVHSFVDSAWNGISDSWWS